MYRATVGCYNNKVILFPRNAKTYYLSNESKLRKVKFILKACIVRREKLECYGSLFAIKVEMGTTYQYLGIFVVGDIQRCF